MKPFYISTAIAYASAKPHIGNTFEIVLADAIARYKRLQGYDVYFQTGTDEHGLKIEQKAIAAGMNPQTYVNQISNEIKNTWDLMNTSYDHFVRTTDPDHKQKVQIIFNRLYEQGDIYKGIYEGMYCTPCESFFTANQLIEGKCPDCGGDVEVAREEAYFFKLTKYAQKLEDYINSNPDFLAPNLRKNEMINNFIKPGLQDLSVSRSTFKWGIEVPFDKNHVIYVWLDALSNYITFLGYAGTNENDFKKYWPADVHLIGKDIFRFHAIYWPCFLMALNLPLPKKIFGHPWLLTNEDKMSKSKGNVLYPEELVNEFGVEAIRYYLLHEIPYAADGNITRDLIIERTNSDLANNLGNLLQRTLTMAQKYFKGIITNPDVNNPIDQQFIAKINSLQSYTDAKMDKLEVASALEEIISLMRASNKYIDETTPWSLANKNDQLPRLETIIYNLLEGIRVAAILIGPFLPTTSQKMINQLNIDDKATSFNKNNKYHTNEPYPLFERIQK